VVRLAVLFNINLYNVGTLQLVKQDVCALASLVFHTLRAVLLPRSLPDITAADGIMRPLATLSVLGEVGARYAL
jgi:hypothetical protein